MQRVTPDIGTAFQPVEDELRKAFLLELFKGDTTQIPRRAFTSLPVKQSGIALPDPTQTAGANWPSSYVITGNLSAALHMAAEFSSGDHALLMGEGREEIRRGHAEAAETALGEGRDAASAEDARWIGRIT